MFQPDLYRTDAPGLLAAKARATAELRAGVADLPAAGRGEDTRPTGVAAWSLAHDPATLLLSGNPSGPVGNRDPEEVFRWVTGLLFRPDIAHQGQPAPSSSPRRRS